MAWTNLIAQIGANIYTNLIKKVSGDTVRDQIVDVVNNLGNGYVYKGVATISTTPPEIEGDLAWTASAIGTYTDLGGVEIATAGLYLITRTDGVYSITQVLNLAEQLFKIGTYITAPSDPIALTAGVNNKISLPVSVVTSPAPYGFDIYTTPQGTALRFIGTGLGNGDSAVLRMDTMAGLLAETGATDKIIFKAVTRPYTETDFNNAVDIPGYKISRKMPNNDLGSIALSAPYFTVTAGDLIEIAAVPDDAITIVIDTFGFEAIQLKY